MKSNAATPVWAVFLDDEADPRPPRPPRPRVARPREAGPLPAAAEEDMGLGALGALWGMSVERR